MKTRIYQKLWDIILIFQHDRENIPHDDDDDGRLLTMQRYALMDFFLL